MNFPDEKSLAFSKTINARSTAQNADRTRFCEVKSAFIRFLRMAAGQTHVPSAFYGSLQVKPTCHPLLRDGYKSNPRVLRFSGTAASPTCQPVACLGCVRKNAGFFVMIRANLPPNLPRMMPQLRIRLGNHPRLFQNQPRSTSR